MHFFFGFRLTRQGICMITNAFYSEIYSFDVSIFIDLEFNIFKTKFLGELEYSDKKSIYIYIYIYIYIHMVFVECIQPFEYLENQLCFLGTQSKEKLIAHQQMISCGGYSVTSKMSLSELVYCVTVAFMITELVGFHISCKTLHHPDLSDCIP